jgi:hypothetical protein
VHVAGALLEAEVAAETVAETLTVELGTVLRLKLRAVDDERSLEVLEADTAMELEESVTETDVAATELEDPLGSAVTETEVGMVVSMLEVVEVATDEDDEVLMNVVADTARDKTSNESNGRLK